MYLLILSLVPAGEVAAQAPVPTVDEIIDGMQALEDRVRSLPSWKIEYREIKDTTKDIPHGWLKEYPPQVCVFARRDDEWIMASTRPLDATEPELCFIWRGDGIAVDKIRERVMIRADPNFGLWNSAFYTNALFLNIRSRREYIDPHTRDIEGHTSPYEEMQFALPSSVAKRRDKYRVRPNPEAIHGNECVVIEEPDVDVLWIDVSHGYLCLRRQVFQSTGGLLVEWQNDDIRQWLPGLYLPYLQTIDAYNDQSETPPEVRGKLRIHQVHTISSMSFEHLPDSAFNIALPTSGQPVVADYVRGFEYKPRLAELSPEELVDEALLALSLNQPPNSRPLYVVALCNAILAGILLLVYQVRRMRRSAKR